MGIALLPGRLSPAAFAWLSPQGLPTEPLETVDYQSLMNNHVEGLPEKQGGCHNDYREITDCQPITKRPVEGHLYRPEKSLPKK